MSEPSVQTHCLSCGARLTAGAATCDLCGWPVAGTDLNESEPEPVAEYPIVDGVEPTESPRVGRGIFCNQCGWENPPASRFCARCGARLQEEARSNLEPPAPPRANRSKRMGADGDPEPGPVAMAEAEFRRMGFAITAGALMLVIVLYAVTAFSKQVFVAEPPIPPQERAADGTEVQLRAIPADIAQRAGALRASADSLTGAVRAARLAEVVNLYLAQGFFIDAARAQAEVATALQTPQAWADAGNIAYRAMQEEEGPLKIEYAREAIEAYNRSLELDPENHDVRTDLATAYLGSNNPMEGVRQIRRVLDARSDHVQANFNYGVMLSMIGREDQAIVQFERVMELAAPGSESHRQAELALRELRGR